MKERKISIKLSAAIIFFLCILSLGDALSQTTDEAGQIKITAPNESAAGSVTFRGDRPFFIEGWVCGTNFAPMIINEIRTANTISEEILNKIQLLKDGIDSIKAQAAEGSARGLPREKIMEIIASAGRSVLSRSDAVNLTLTDYQAYRTISARNMDDIERYYIDKFRKDMVNFKSTAEKGGNRLADTSLKATALDVKLEEATDNYETYALSDCYSKSDLDVFIKNQAESYQNATALFKTYQELKSDIEGFMKGNFVFND